jgi:acetolactate synthase-1/2/3 large subunit
MATSGPGATNLVTGIANAYMDSVPLVCITGQVRSQMVGYDAFQETDITGITLPITKHNYLVTRVKEIMPALREAFYIARSGRPGPVLIDITKDAQQSAIEDWEYDESNISLPGYRPDLRPASQIIRRAAKTINSAQRPIILAGHGILLSNAMEEVRQFAERAQTPVAVTLLGLGAIPSSHPLNMGMMGMHGESWVNTAIQEADLLLAFGMRFDDRVTGRLNTYAPQARKIQIDIDPSEINKNIKVAIINNGYLGMIRQWQEFFYERRYAATLLRSPDFVKLAEAHGLTGLRVSRRSEGEAAIRRAEETAGTVVIDFRVEQEDSVYPMVPAGADLHDMIRRPSAIAETAMDE